MIRVGVDVGGTFTDIACVRDGRLVTAKVPSTPADQSKGVAAAIAAVGVEQMDVLAHGTTVATNALLERTGARTALLTTEGFRDVIEIGRQNRASLYDLGRRRPAPLVPRELRFTVRERMGPDGVVSPLDEDSVVAAIDAIGAAQVEAVAVCLLFSHLHDEHERRVGELLRARLPGVHVSLSCEVLREVREYERTATTAANAYLGPRIEEYLRRLDPEPLVMQSSGGVVTVAEALPAACLLSGPAAGVVGAAAVARAAGFVDVLTLDMGGTSADVAAIVEGTVQMTTETVVAGVPVRFPSVDVVSVSAGGGSIAFLDAGGALRVGPRSAGAVPGPACYGRGGEEPTVTDANLSLGRLRDGVVLGGEVTLRRPLADRALARAGVDADGVVRVANAELARALRLVSVERGLDPRDFALVAFGGAGPLHACELAEELGIGTVLVPAPAGVVSALGLTLADMRRDAVGPPDGDFETLERRTTLPEGRVERFVDARYHGQSFELTVPAEGWETAFHDAHERRYGYRDDAPVEPVSRRVRTVAPASAEIPDVPPGDEVEGPTVLELDGATAWIPAGWSGAGDGKGTLVLRRR